MATWRQMERLADMGLARHIGMSNMTLPKLKAVLPLCRVKPAGTGANDWQDLWDEDGTDALWEK